MIRAFASLLAAVTLLAGAGQAHAQGFGFDRPDLIGGGPNFSIGGSNPIPRQTVSFAGNYAPGTILINTAERRLYLVLPNGQALAMASVSAATVFAGAAPTASPPRRNGRAGPRHRRCWRAAPTCRATWPAASTIR